MALTNTLTTERLSLILLTENDSEFIFQLLNSMDWITFIGDRNIESLESAKRYIEKVLHTENFDYRVIRVKTSNVSVGIISFIKRDYLPYFDIGFALLPEFYGHGYALEAATCVIEECQKAGHETILATVLPSNTKSIRLVTQLGFRHERDIVTNDNKVHVFCLSLPR